MAHGPLTHPPFRRLFAGQTLSSIGDQIVPVALVFAVLDLAGPHAGVGLVLAAATLPFTLMLLVGGVWADRLPRMRVMLAADGIRATVQITSGILLLTGHADLWMLCALQAVNGTARAFFDPASTGVVADIVPDGHLQEANALLTMQRNGARVFGPVIAGVLIATVGPAWGLILDAASYIANAFALSGLKPVRRAPSDATGGTSFAAELKEGLDAFVSRRWVVACVAHFSCFIGFALRPLLVVGPALSLTRGGSTWWATILTAQGCGAVAAATVIRRRTVRRPLAFGLTLQLVTWPTFLLVLAHGAPTWCLCALGALASGSLAAFAVLWLTALQREIPAAQLSRVSAYDWLGSSIMEPVGLVGAGIAVGTLGAATTLEISALAVLVSAAGALAVPSVRRIGTDRQSALPVEAQEPVSG